MNEQAESAIRFGRVILAAGQATRMGEPKALLPFGEQNVIERVFEAGAALVELDVVVVNPALADVVGAFLPAGVELVVNSDPASEQIDSLKLGIERLVATGKYAGEGFFIHPVDYPLAGEADYRALAEAAVSPRAQGVEVLQPVFSGRHGHPVFCVGALARRFLDLRPGQTARDVVRSSRVDYVSSANPGVVEDMNTPEDYSRLLELFQGQNPA